MTDFNLPDLGEGLHEAEIVAWHVAEGDHVVTDQPLLSVETEKAVVEIPSPHAGRIAQILAKPGERVAVGAPVLRFEEGPHPDTGTVVGDLPSPKPTAATPAAPSVRPSRTATVPTAVRASPAVRARAQTLGVDLARVSPTGPDGTITMRDVEAAAGPATQPSHALRGAARTMALNMTRAWREVAHATLHDDADVECWSADADVTVRLIRAIVAACGVEPELNATFDSATMELRPNDRVDLGLAIDSPDGLFVPVLRDVGRATPAAWRTQIDAVKSKVQARTLAPADLRGPTITLSNFGTLAGRHAALIIVPPQVAILGAGRIGDRAIRTAGAPAVHRFLPLSLSFDHRAVDGGQAARFLRAVITDLEQP
jgi:pyruvate dehydrogenase E2 component (dihydrolipoamide acetyltransferase)